MAEHRAAREVLQREILAVHAELTGQASGARVMAGTQPSAVSLESHKDLLKSLHIALTRTAQLVEALRREQEHNTRLHVRLADLLGPLSPAPDSRFLVHV